MFDSGITADSFVKGMISEIDYPDIPGADASITLSRITEHLNRIEKILYSEIIREIATVDFENPQNNLTIEDINDKVTLLNAGEISFNEIVGVLADDTELTKTNATNFLILRNVFTYNFDKFLYKKYYVDESVMDLTISFKVLPEKKTITSSTVSGNVNIPFEFLPLIRSYIRGEEYKLINEDNIAAKWLNDFNAQIEEFKVYIEKNRSAFGQE
jgi:hypothetical protein